MHKSYQAVGALTRDLVDELHAMVHKPFQGRLYILDLDANVVDALALSGQVPGDTSVITRGLDKLEVALTQGQEGNLYLLVWYFQDLLQR
jgi:hypothetical protein